MLFLGDLLRGIGRRMHVDFVRTFASSSIDLSFLRMGIWTLLLTPGAKKILIEAATNVPE
jgi:hypothetical protein